MPRSSRTVLAKPSQPIRYLERTVSALPSRSRNVAVTPSASCTKLSTLTQCRNVTCGNVRAKSCRIGSNQVCGHGIPRSGLTGRWARSASAGMRTLETPSAHLVNYAELTAELHGTDADLQHLGGIELILAFLHQHRCNAPPPKVGRKRQANRPATGNQHRCFQDGGTIVHGANIDIAFNLLRRRFRALISLVLGHMSVGAAVTSRN